MNDLVWCQHDSFVVVISFSSSSARLVAVLFIITIIFAINILIVVVVVNARKAKSSPSSDDDVHYLRHRHRLRHRRHRICHRHGHRHSHSHCGVFASSIVCCVTYSLFIPGNSQKPNPFIVIDEQYRAAFLAEEKRFEMQAYHIINNQLKIEFESKEKGKRQEMLALVMEETLKKHEEVKDSIDIHLQSVKDSIVKLISDEPPVASSPLFPVTPPEPFPAPQRCRTRE